MQQGHGAVVEHHGLHHHGGPAENLDVCRQQELKDAVQDFQEEVCPLPGFRDGPQDAHQQADRAPDQRPDQREDQRDARAVPEQAAVLLQQVFHPVAEIVRTVRARFRRLAGDRLLADGLVHNLPALFFRDAGQSPVEGFAQLRVPLLDCDADIGLLLRHLQIGVLGKVDFGETGVCVHGGQRGGLVAEKNVALAGAERDNHRGGVFEGGLHLRARDLLEQFVPHGALLRRAGGAPQVGDPFCAGIFAIFSHQREDARLIVVVGEVHRLPAVRRGAHAGDDRVQLAGSDAGRQAVPLGLDNLQVVSGRIRKPLGNFYVISVRVLFAVADFYGAVRVVGLRPVVGGVAAFHADPQDLFSAGTAGTAGRNSRQKHHAQEHTRSTSDFFLHLSVSFRFVDFPLRGPRPSEPAEL